MYCVLVLARASTGPAGEDPAQYKHVLNGLLQRGESIAGRQAVCLGPVPWMGEQVAGGPQQLYSRLLLQLQGQVRQLVQVLSRLLDVVAFWGNVSASKLKRNTVWILISVPLCKQVETEFNLDSYQSLCKQVETEYSLDSDHEYPSLQAGSNRIQAGF